IAAMGKVIQIVLSIAVVLAILGSLGVGIATLITVLNVQNTQNSNADASTGAPPPNGKTIPSPKPISNSDPRFKSYQGMSDLLKSWMNTSVDPCNDFYTYTCGAGKQDQGMSFDVSDDAITESMLKLLKDDKYFTDKPLPLQQAKWFYDVCVKRETTVKEEDKVAHSKKIFTDLRANNPNVGFPALFAGEQNPATPDALGSFLGYAIGKYGYSSLVDTGVDTDWKDPHNAKGGYALLIDQPATLEFPTFYTKLYKDYKDDLTAGILSVINSAAVMMGVPKPDQDQARKDAQAVADLDYALATKYSTDETTRRQFARMYNPLSVDGLQKLAPFINWNNYLNNALSPINVQVNGTFRTLTNEVDKLSLLSADIVKGTILARTINNYIYVSFLNNIYLPAADTQKNSVLHKYRREKRPINRRLRRVPKTDELASDFTKTEASCVNTISSYLTWSSSRLFVEANYPDEASRNTIREQTNSIIRSILVAFRAQIDILDWMSPASKKGAYQKIDNLVVNIAFPDWVLDNNQLSDYYSLLDTNATDDYYTQLDALKAFQLYEAFSPLVGNKPADRTDFSSTAAVTNAWYQPEMNSITFPGGILHAPFYDASYPASVNYGGLGVIAGHELTHGFDDEGVQWEGTGILNSWMDDNSTTSFTEMAQCVVDEYTKFCPVGTDCVDGGQTQGENIADNGGIQAAYKAFKAYEALNGPDPLLPGDFSVFSADQLFFLGFAQVWCQFPPDQAYLERQILVDPHSPSLYRVLGTVQNIPAFQKAFNCPVGSVYAPKEHCNVWTSEPTSGAPLNDKGEPAVAENDLNVAPVERISPQDMDKYTAYQTGLATLKASADLSINPCEDFYHYTCGNFPGKKTTFYDLDQENYRVISNQLEDKTYQDTVIPGSEALKNFNKLYKSCKAEAATSTITTTNYMEPKVLNFRKYINQDVSLIGGTGDIHLTHEDYGSALGYLSFQLGIDTLVSPGVDTYWKDPVGRGYQLFIDQPTTFHVRAFYDGDAWDKQKPDYVKQVTNVVKAYVKLDKTAALPTNYVDLINDALDLERSIAIDYSGTDAERRQYLRQWNPMAKDALPPMVDWDKYFALAPKDAQDWYNDPTKQIILNEVEKTPRLFTTGLTGKDETVVNYLFIRLLLANSGLIPCSDGKCLATQKSLAEKNIPEHTGKGLVPKGRRHPLPSFSILDEVDANGPGCADEISVMADAQGRVYIDARYPTEDDRQTIRNTTIGVMTNIVDAMKGMIQQLDWMDEPSKANAIIKASNIHVNVAYPDFILDNVQLDAKYKDLAFADTDSYYAMLDKVTIYSIAEQFKLLKATTADRGDFLGQTAVVNAWYDPELNSITFPAGILQQPFFDINFPAGLNYGGIGVVAGHELTHGFDDEGVQWDFDGRLHSWMDPSSQAGFNKMAQCVIDEYSTFCPLPEDRSPNCTDGTRTQGENIADNGGIHSAWRAYEAHIELNGPDPLFMDRVYSQYTEHQMYFLGFAQVWCMQKNYVTESFVSNRLMTDPHSLGPYRVLGTLQNIPAFQANFNCPLGSAYAPMKHCNVWVPTKMA
ncbi:hypothetical protein PFISCL1PPCAC_15129, partial [Pristionchus fissidentatus]